MHLPNWLWFPCLSHLDTFLLWHLLFLELLLHCVSWRSYKKELDEPGPLPGSWVSSWKPPPWKYVPAAHRYLHSSSVWCGPGNYQGRKERDWALSQREVKSSVRRNAHQSYLHYYHKTLKHCLSEGVLLIGKAVTFVSKLEFCGWNLPSTSEVKANCGVYKTQISWND